MMDPTMPSKRPDPPAFAFWCEEDHVLVSGNDRPKSALMVLRCAAALLATLLEREGVDQDDLCERAEERALSMLRMKSVRFTQGTADRLPDVVVTLPHAMADVKLAPLLTPVEHELLATVAVRMAVGLNRPGTTAVFLCNREAAWIIGLLADVSFSDDAPIEWVDPFKTEEKP